MSVIDQDRLGLPLSVGDYVLWQSGWFMWEGRYRIRYKLCQLYYHRKDKRILLNKGLFNQWEGKHLVKVEGDVLERLLPFKGRPFAIMEDGSPMLVTDGHFFGKDQKGLEKYNEFMMEQEYKFLFGETGKNIGI